MGCTDAERHDLACPHLREPQVRWQAADGCGGAMCTGCWGVYGGSGWPAVRYEHQAVKPGDRQPALPLALAVDYVEAPWPTPDREPSRDWPACPATVDEAQRMVGRAW